MDQGGKDARVYPWEACPSLLCGLAVLGPPLCRADLASESGTPAPARRAAPSHTPRRGEGGAARERATCHPGPRS
eukprot:9482377-Pyramimonas_sp.AAC.1